MKKIILATITLMTIQAQAIHLSLGAFAHPMDEDTRTASVGVKHFFYEDINPKEVSGYLGGLGLSSGKNGSVMVVITPMAFAPKPVYSIGVDIVIPAIQKNDYQSGMLGVSLNINLSEL